MMRYKNKFLSILLCLALIIFALVGLSACKKEAEEEEKEDVIVAPQEETLEFSINNKELVIYSTFQLHVNKTDGVSFTSADESIATVDETGLVYANGFGETMITAKAGDLQAQCRITVVGQDIIPSIQVAQDTISLVWSTGRQVGSSFDINPQIRFNGATFSDGEFIYTSSDPDVVSVSENGQISAKGFGNAVVSVRGSWREGFDNSLLSTNISVSVMPDVSIELIPESTLISTVNKTIDGTSYRNRTAFTTRVTLDGTNYNTPIKYIIDGEEIDWSSTVEGEDNVVSWYGNAAGNSVVTIRGSEIVAIKAGTANVVAKCVVEGIEISSMPTVIEVTAPTVQADSERSVYNVKADPTYVFTAIEGDFISLSINGKTYNEYVDVDTLSLDMSEFYEDVLGDNTIEIATTKYNYRYHVKFVTHIITNGEEFRDCITNDKASTIYAILTNDITFAVGEFKASTATFRGVFDGQGHTIDAMDTKIASEYGLFGRLGGELKNFALINATVFGKESTVLGERTYESGSVKNVYVQAKYEENTQKDYTDLDAQNTQYYCGLFFRGFRFENVLVNIEYPTDVEGYALCAYTNVIVVKNTYAVGNALQLAKTNSSVSYPNVSAMLSANLALLTSKNGFADFWYFSDKIIKFGDLQIADPRIEEKITTDQAITLSLNELAEEEITGITVDDVAIEIPSNGSLTLQVYEYSANVEHVLKIYTNAGIVEQPFIFTLSEERKTTTLYEKDSVVLNSVDYDGATSALLNGKVFKANGGEIVMDLSTLIVGAEYDICLYNNQNEVIKQPVFRVTHIIATVDELKAYLPQTSERSAITEGTYAVLVADIDFNGAIYGAGGIGASYGYNGRFNGLGHAIKNVNIAYKGGFFGALKKDVIIENTQFINLTYSGTGVDGSLICATTGRAGNGETSKMNNVYIQGTINTQGTYNGILNSGDTNTHLNKLIITNSIIDVQYTNPAEKSYVFGSGESDVRLNNVYVTSNATQYTDKDTTNPYATATDLLTATAEQVAAWGGYWQVIDGEIYFNSNKIVAKT